MTTKIELLKEGESPAKSQDLDLIANKFGADCAWSVAKSAIRSKHRFNNRGGATISGIFAPETTYYKPRDNGAGRFTSSAKIR